MEFHSGILFQCILCMRLLGTKMQCQEKEDNILEEEDSDDEGNEHKGKESSNSEMHEDEGNKCKDKESTDKRTDKPAKRKWKLLTNKVLCMIINIIIYSPLKCLYVFQ